MNINLEFENEDLSHNNIEDNHPRTNYGEGWTQETLEELNKCKKSPYYFATKYLKVKNHPYSEDVVDFYTHLSEEEFNKQFKELTNGK